MIWWFFLNVVLMFVRVFVRWDGDLKNIIVCGLVVSVCSVE